MRGGWQFCPIALVLACAAACAARPVTPVAMSQPGDDQLSCDAIIEQIKANRAGSDEWLRKDKGVEQANTFFVLIGPVFLIDLSNVEQVKARSMIDRNNRLVLLGKSKGCEEPK